MSPKMWYLVADSFRGCLVRPSFSLELMLSVVEKWCREVQLTVNPEKAEALLLHQEVQDQACVRTETVRKVLKGYKVSVGATCLQIKLEQTPEAGLWEGHAGLLGLQKSLRINVGFGAG